jgi:hypothetical protein
MQSVSAANAPSKSRGCGSRRRGSGPLVRYDRARRDRRRARRGGAIQPRIMAATSPKSTGTIVPLSISASAEAADHCHEVRHHNYTARADDLGHGDRVLDLEASGCARVVVVPHRRWPPLLVHRHPHEQGAARFECRGRPGGRSTVAERAAKLVERSCGAARCSPARPVTATRGVACCARTPRRLAA